MWILRSGFAWVLCSIRMSIRHFPTIPAAPERRRVFPSRVDKREVCFAECLFKQMQMKCQKAQVQRRDSVPEKWLFMEYGEKTENHGK